MVGQGERVVGVWSLTRLAEEKRSVITAHRVRPMPAAVVLNMPCMVVLRMIERGLFVYEKAERNPKPNPWRRNQKGVCDADN